ncbi:MAG: cytochrome c oxidase subunit II [Magnetospirillum sp.]|nr:cytochrome c oxidase subunit II [Magnetospirillum sp.]
MRSIVSARAFAAFAAVAFVAFFAGAALAAQPQPWQLGMQPSASPIKDFIASFHNMLLVIITLITIFVLALLLYTMVRFRASANPNPSKTAHHTLLEVVWTAVPILILAVIAIPSFKLIYFADKAPDAEFTLKVTGRQWYWNYQYPDHGDFQFDSYMVQDSDLKPGQARLLEVDNRVVVPVGAKIRVTLHGADVIHSWFVPALGVQKYTMPGRINEVWMMVDRPGVYYGQCNQICGINHAYMPIAIEAVDRATFDRWTAEAKRRFAQDGSAPLSVADLRARDERTQTAQNVAR